MNIRKALSKETVLIGLKARTKHAVIVEIVDRLVAAGRIKPEKRHAVLEAVLARESKMSTGMQSGIALPHGKSDAVDEMVAAIAVKKEGVDFKSMDGEPARIFIFTISPARYTGPHIQFLAEASRFVHNAETREAILQAETPEEILGMM